MATFYVKTYADGGRDDGGRNGSSGQEWATLAYACTRVTSANNLIYMNNGNYTESSQCGVYVGVSIEGQSESGVVITASYVGSVTEPLVKLHTANGWTGTFGNQSITKLTFNGNDTGNSCIIVNYRSSVSISHVTIYDFLRGGITFYGMPMASWGGTSIFEPDRSMPDHWCTGNSITYCDITNCAQGIGDDALIRIGQQDGIILSYNSTYQPPEGNGTNCGGIKFYDEGWNKNTDCHHNNVIVDLNPSNNFNFSLEMWFELGGCHYYNNVFQGGADFDCGGKGASTYSVWFHNNEVGYPDYQLYNHYGINFEASFSDVIVEKNYVHHTKEAFYFSQIWPNSGESGRDNHPYNTELRRIRISSNLFVNLGRDDGASDWEPVFGIYCGRDTDTLGQNVLEDISILNNTIHCGSVTPDSYYVAGIWLPNSDLTVDNLIIRNNIITGFTGGSTYSAPIFGTGLYGTGMDINSYYIDNNCFYGNGNSNAILRVSGYPAPTTSANNITSNPSFTGGAPYKYTLSSSSSPAYHAGQDVDLATDFIDHSFHATTPSMGAYEFFGRVPNTTTFALSDVVNVVDPTTHSLVGCFADASAGLFDSNYEGSKDRLSNFRNYG